MNCQTCVVAFEARIRGFDVKAKPNVSGSMSETLSYNTRLAWIDPSTGKPPAYTMGRGRGTARKTLRAIRDLVKDGGRYTLQFVWKFGGGHIVNVDTDSFGNIRIKDNQRGNGERSEWLGDVAVLEYLKDKKCDKSMHLTRIDNLDFTPDVVNEILEARR